MPTAPDSAAHDEDPAKSASPPHPPISTCPECGGRLGPPVSGEVHCYVECIACGTRFDLKDPRVDLGTAAFEPAAC